VEDHRGFAVAAEGMETLTAGEHRTELAAGKGIAGVAVAVRTETAVVDRRTVRLQLAGSRTGEERAAYGIAEEPRCGGRWDRSGRRSGQEHETCPYQP
jgi:hypothetical protein